MAVAIVAADTVEAVPLMMKVAAETPAPRAVTRISSRTQVLAATATPDAAQVAVAPV